MIDINLKYGALLFLSTSDITPSPDTVSTLITLFRDREFIPYMEHQEFRVMGGGKPQPVRMKLIDTKNEWSIAFTEKRLDIEQFATDPKGTNLGDIKSFAKTSSELINRIMVKFNKRASRIGINSNSIIREMTEDQLEKAYDNFFLSSGFYLKNKPFEWDWRAVSRIPFDIDKLKDTINVITTIKRVRGQLNTMPIERLNFLLDINTTDLNSETRFETTHVEAFFSSITEVYDVLLKEFEERINA